MYKTVSNCPLSTPFYNGTTCIQCQGVFNIFNMEISQCQKCPSGYKLHTTKHTCELVPHYTNFSALVNYIGAGNNSLLNISARLKALSMARKVYICPSSAPLALKNGTCVGCNSSTHFVDLQTMSCNKSVTISNFPILKKARVIQIGTANLTNL